MGKPGDRDTLFSDDDVRSRTAELASDPGFEASDRLKRLLVFLGERAGEGTRVTQYEIATRVMNLGDDFDPTVDAHVRIEVGRLRKALELHYASHAPEDGARISVPKGSYRPQLIHVAATRTSLPGTGRPLIDRDVTTVFTGIGSSSALTAESGELIAAELRAHCFASPLSGTGKMRFLVRPGVTYDACRDLARSAGAALALTVQIYRVEDDYRVLLEACNVGTGDVLFSQRQAHRVGRGEGVPLGRIARGIANTLCDPILGTVPALAAKLTNDRDLGVVLSAYHFMATQKHSLIPGILDGLQQISRDRAAAPAHRALLAEIARVSGWIHGRDMRADAHECLEMAEAALAEDTNDLTCRISLGFTRLNAGLIESALHTGKTILKSPAPTSLTYKARLLVALADTEGTCHDLLADDPLDDGTPFFMKEFAQIIPRIRWSEIGEAEQMIANSLFPNIFWLHVFHTAVLVEAGERRRAAQSAERVRRGLSGIQTALPRMIVGCFPKKNEHSYLLRGLHDAGLRFG